MRNMQEVPFEGFPMVTPVGTKWARPANLQDHEFTQFLVEEKQMMLAELPIDDVVVGVQRYAGRIAQIEPSVSAVSDVWSGLGWRDQLLQACVSRDPRGDLLTGVRHAIRTTRTVLLKEKDLAAVTENVECIGGELI